MLDTWGMSLSPSHSQVSDKIKNTSSGAHVTVGNDSVTLLFADSGPVPIEIVDSKCQREREKVLVTYTFPRNCDRSKLSQTGCGCGSGCGCSSHHSRCNTYSGYCILEKVSMGGVYGWSYCTAHITSVFCVHKYCFGNQKYCFVIMIMKH